MSYKYVSEDDNVYNVEHPDGSQFSIAKDAVGPGVHKQIKALEPAELKEVTLDESDPKKSKEKFAPEDQSEFGKNFRDFIGWKTKEDAPTPNETPPATTRFDEYNTQSTLPVAPAAIPEIARSVAEAHQMPAVASPQAPAPQPVIEQDPFAIQGQALDVAKQANTEMGQAAAAGGQQQAKVWQDYAKQVSDIDTKYQPMEDRLNKQNQELYGAIQNQKIDPNRLWNNMGAGNKVLSAISIILGGVGAGMQGNGAQNMALGVIEKEIDRDIDAQKAELGKKQTLFSENLRRLGDARAARSATKAQLMSVAQAQANSIAARSGSAEAMAKAKLLNSQVDLQKAAYVRQAKMFSMISEEGQSNPEKLISYLRVYDPPKAKEMEARYVPGVGMASVPVSEKARDELATRQNLQSQVHKLRSWAREHSGSLSPDEITYGKALANTVQDGYRSANGQGVFKESEAEFVKGVVAEDPTAFFNNYRVDPKYKALEESNLARLNGLKGSYGLPRQSMAQQFSPEEQKYAQWAKQNPNDPRAAVVMKKLGLQ